MSQTVISIRAIQHFLYCPHRWSLLELEGAWVDNAFTAKAATVHKRVHEISEHRHSKGLCVYSSVRVYNDLPEYGLYGVIDILEADRRNTASELCIVEYKPTRSRTGDFNEDDAAQVFAQKICADSVFGCSCRAEIYYADVKRRVKLPFDTEFDSYNRKLISVLSEMRKAIDNGTVPPITDTTKCSGCSLADVCLPSPKLPADIRELIRKETAFE